MSTSNSHTNSNSTSSQSTPTKATGVGGPNSVPAGAAHRPCRNVFIYGFCKNQEKGCPFNHDGSTAPPVQTQVIGHVGAASPDRAAAAGGGRGAGAATHAHALTYSPGVFTAQHYEHYRSSSQERSFAKSEPTSAVSSPTPSNLRSAVAAAAHAQAHPHTAQAAPMGAAAANVQQVTQQMTSLGLTPDQHQHQHQHQHQYSSMPPSDDSLGHSGFDHVDGDEQAANQPTSYFPMILSTPTVAPDSASLDHHLYFPPNPSAHHHHPPPRSMRGLHHFYVPENIRADLTHRAQDCYRPAPPHVASKLPATVHKYHTLVPLEPNADPTVTSAPAPSSYLGYPCAWYRATNSETGEVHALMRVIGYRLPASAVGGEGAVLQSVVDMWKKVPEHPGICRLREGFTTMAFGGESSLVLAYDYFANATTLLSNINQPTPISPTTGKAKAHGKSQHAHHPERLLWSYLSQLVSAMHAIHSVGLTLRSSLHASKILVPKPHAPPNSTVPPAAVRNRVRLTALGALEFALAAAASRQGNDPLAEITLGKADLEQAQQADWMALGQVMVTLASGSSSSPDNNKAPKSMAQVQDILRPYAGIATVVFYLLDPNLHKRPEEIVGMCSGAILGEVDALRTHVDRLENEMAKELENGRVARIMVKLNFITERPEFALGPRWSETGDRYLITLFRDYVFHPVDVFGRPVLDVGHIMSCLNKLDVGVDESIMLTSRDERNCLIVTYAELKRCVEETFNELIGGLGTVAS